MLPQDSDSDFNKPTINTETKAITLKQVQHTNLYLCIPN